MGDVTYLTGHLLIAMPGMADPNFVRTVTYICEHTDQGALGIVINRPLQMELGEVFQQLALAGHDSMLVHQPVMRGGPVQTERGFVLHEPSRQWDATVEVSESVHLTTSQDILAALADGSGPKRALMALGYAGWGAGQLEVEIAANAWLSVPATSAIVFDTPFEARWAAAAGLLGINLAMISSEAGHA
ncbi:MAG: YqgE/AlgH family protein [Gammaproteobacteria bacterium]|nr:YqgE/AlgH family protein [Gammaproteobacteria bacterium]